MYFFLRSPRFFARAGSRALTKRQVRASRAARDRRRVATRNQRWPSAAATGPRTRVRKPAPRPFAETTLATFSALSPHPSPQLHARRRGRSGFNDSRDPPASRDGPRRLQQNTFRPHNFPSPPNPTASHLPIPSACETASPPRPAPACPDVILIPLEPRPPSAPIVPDDGRAAIDSKPVRPRSLIPLSARLSSPAAVFWRVRLNGPVHTPLRRVRFDV